MNKILKFSGLGIAGLLLASTAVVAVQSGNTERDIDAFEARVTELGVSQPPAAFDETQIANLPSPVQRYFRFVFRAAPANYSVVRVNAAGEFRRPLTKDFNPIESDQVLAAGVPALMFSASTTVLPGIWARAYDFFAQGQMEMKAKILSAITVVDERETPQLNQISLRRWLLESALCPTALLPGGPVIWEPIDDASARAVVAWNGMRASMIANFDTEGRMTSMVAEADGDLSTPYHGSGEHVARTDYRQVGAQMIPMGFTISRMAEGRLYPFYEGRVGSISFE
ncbi:MAG: DUF6544 family protein [Burkholderiaceae bacterium]